MMKSIAIQKDLTPIKNYLSEKGYNVKEFEGNAEFATKQFGDVDAIVVTGLEENVLGMENTSSKASIIDARGMKPEEVEQAIASR